MVTQQEQSARQLTGTKAQQELGAQVLTLMLARGMFMSANAVIRVSLGSLVAFLQSQGNTSSQDDVVAALQANPDIFALETGDDEVYVLTLRDGRAPADRPIAVGHTFASRFLTPKPRPERAAAPRQRPRVPEATIDVLADLAGLPLDEVVVPVEVEVEAEALVAALPELEPEPIEEQPAVVVRTAPPPTAVPTDVSDVDDVKLAMALRERLGSDPRVANFGEQWLMEDRVPRFSRGDMRRLREYMQEKEQPLTDDDLVQDVIGVRPGSVDFDLMRFGLNYRLSNEHREFEFVGTGNQRFWSTSGLPQIGTTRRKLNEIGTDYRFLLDQQPSEPAYRSRTAIDHTLTFYEYVHGLLPYDAEMQELLAGPITPSQKSAVLTFECPQSFTTYLVELRFPTPNRGGYILGLDDFYTENLVPGALISIQRTENDGHYRVEYIPEGARSDQLLELDERRAQRYVFRPTTFACGVDSDLLLTEARFGGLANEKPLDEKVRRRVEAVIAATFERIGDEREGNYSLEFTQLLAGVNIERPISADLLRNTLDNDDTGAFSRDPDATDSYTYVPGTTP